MTTARRLFVTPDPQNPDPSNPPAADPPAVDPPAATPPATDPPAVDPPPAQEPDWKAESRKWEGRSKENSKKAAEYDKLVAASQTETERAQADATAARQEAEAMRGQIAAAEIKAALTGVVADPAAVVDDLNLAKFVTDEGSIDAEAVKALRDRYAALSPTGTEGPRTPAPTPGQGANSTPRPGQITREALETMSPEAIVKARKDGLLNDVLGIRQ